MLRKLLAILLLVLFCLSWGSSALAGFGISPPYVKNDYLIPGSSYEQTISLLRSDAEEDLQANIEIDAPEIASWISIDKGTSFPLPKGELRVPMKVRVTVPGDAPIGGYQGYINVKVSSLSAGGPGVAVALGARLDIDLRVTNETKPDFVVRLVDIPDFEELEWPWNAWPLKYFFYRAKVSLEIENTGNVKIAPSKVYLDIYDINEKELLESSYDTRMKKVAPFSTETIFADFPTKLGVGQYWGKIKVYKEDQIVNSYKLSFEIKPAGSLPDNGLGKWPAILLGSIVVAAAIFLFLFIKFRVWRIFAFMALLIWRIIQLFTAPLAGFISAAYKKYKKKLFNWVLNKAKEHENKKE